MTNLSCADTLALGVRMPDPVLWYGPGSRPFGDHDADIKECSIECAHDVKCNEAHAATAPVVAKNTLVEG